MGFLPLKLIVPFPYRHLGKAEALITGLKVCGQSFGSLWLVSYRRMFWENQFGSDSGDNGTLGVLSIGEEEGATGIGATGPRASERESASERVSERTSEREGFRGVLRFLEVLRCFQRFSEVFQKSLRDPLRGRFPSQRLSVLLPLFLLPLNLSPTVWAFCCHMLALHELHNIPSFTKIISKMIWEINLGWSGFRII